MPPSPIRRGSGHRPAPRQVSPTPSFPRPFIPPAPGTAPADAARPGGRTRPRTRASARASASRRLLRRGGVGPQGGEGLEQERLLPGVAQDRVRESLDGAVPVQERSGRARADPGDAREAIGGVAHQGEVVGDEGRVDAELPPHGCGVADLALQGGGARLRGAPALPPLFRMTWTMRSLSTHWARSLSGVQMQTSRRPGRRRRCARRTPGRHRPPARPWARRPRPWPPGRPPGRETARPARARFPHPSRTRARAGCERTRLRGPWPRPRASARLPASGPRSAAHP
jgi:hypothetical protein